MQAGAARSASPEVPVHLTLLGLIAAGDCPPPPTSGADTALEIFTGAPVPPELDAVVPLEWVTVIAPKGEPQPASASPGPCTRARISVRSAKILWRDSPSWRPGFACLPIT